MIRTYGTRPLQPDAQKGHPARPQPKNRPQAYPPGYVEDLFKARTKLGDFFSIRPVSRLVVRNGPTGDSARGP
jgi:hypothetical protein